VKRRPIRIASAFSIAAIVAAAVAVAATAGRHGGGTTPGTWCGGTRWRLMTLSDAGRARVHLGRTDTSIAEIAGLTPPRTFGTRRTTSFELTSWRLHVVVDRYRVASNGEIILVLYEIPSGKYMDAYLPNPLCLGAQTRDRTGIVAARRVFTDHCPAATAAWQLLGASVDISGVGFWNPVRSTRGALQNGAELRPLTNLQIIAGCGIATR
jgi:hypothetical protein